MISSAEIEISSGSLGSRIEVGAVCVWQPTAALSPEKWHGNGGKLAKETRIFAAAVANRASQWLFSSIIENGYSQLQSPEQPGTSSLSRTDSSELENQQQYDVHNTIIPLNYQLQYRRRHLPK